MMKGGQLKITDKMENSLPWPYSSKIFLQFQLNLDLPRNIIEFLTYWESVHRLLCHENHENSQNLRNFCNSKLQNLMVN